MLLRLKANSKLTRARQILGIDRAVFYTLFLRGWQLIAGFCSVLLVIQFLSPIQQGFQYTFVSVLSLQIFFELGLTFVVMQFASHERAHLNWTAQGTLEGDRTAKARLASLVRLTLKWYSIAAGIFVCLLVPAGLIFFGNSPDSNSVGIWQSPWIWLVLTTAGSLLLSPLFAVLEGCGLVAEVARFRFVQDLTLYPIYWLGLAAGIGLLASPLFQTVRLFTSLGWLLTRQRPFLTDQLRFRLPGVSIHWWREVWPMQWKIALSWVSGYFVFQLFNPVLFIYFGAVVAGQMGMSLALTTAVTTLAMSWISTKSPTFGQLIARRDYKLLDRIFSRTLLQAFFAAISCGVVLLLTVFVLYTLQIPLSQRVLDPLAFVLLTAVAIINVVVFAEAVYLRAHKQEPFLWISIAIAILSALSAYFLGRVYGAMGMAAGSFVIAVISLGVATWIFFVKRHDWHIVEK
jgi:O-antigen/teichoic acid export membrane protein